MPGLVAPGAALLAAALLGASAPLAAATAPPRATMAAPREAIAALDACLRRLDPELDVGLGRIEPLCPGLVAVLESSGAAALLPSDWKRPRSELSASGLRALRRMLAQQPSAPARVAAPDAGALQALARSGRDAGADARGPWARFTRWLRSFVEGLDPASDAPGALARLLDLSVPQRVWTLLGYAAVAALLLFAAAVVRAELRAAGLLGRARAARAARAATAAAGDDGGESAARRLAEVAPLERPAWLLQRLARRLQQLGRLPPPGHLTPREVARSAQFERADDRAPLQAIASAAERVRFGARPPAPEELAPAVAAAAELLQRLEAGAGAGPVAPGGA
jgi:hypothetical protein